MRRNTAVDERVYEAPGATLSNFGPLRETYSEIFADNMKYWSALSRGFPEIRALSKLTIQV